MSNKIWDRRAIRILIANVLVKSGKNVFQIFLNVFIWKQTQDIQVVAMFNLIYLISHMVFFTIFAPIVKKGYRNLLHVFSLIGFAGVYLWIMYLWESAINHLIIIPFIIWFFNSIYWINFHNTQFDLTTQANRWNFEWIRKALRTVASIITPALVGFIITYNYLWQWYSIAFAFGAMFFIAWAFIGLVDLESKSSTKFDIVWVFKKCFAHGEVSKVLYTYALTSFSFSNSIIEVLIPIILFTYVSVELDLGLLVSFFSIVSIIASYIFGKFVHYKHYSKSILYLGFWYSASLLWFVLFDSIEYLVVFSSLITALALLFSIPQKVMSDNVLHKIDGYQNMRSEYMVIREWFQAIGWIGSFIFLYFVDSIERGAIQLVFSVMIIAVIICSIQLSKVDISKD